MSWCLLEIKEWWIEREKCKRERNVREKCKKERKGRRNGREGMARTRDFINQRISSHHSSKSSVNNSWTKSELKDQVWGESEESRQGSTYNLSFFLSILYPFSLFLSRIHSQYQYILCYRNILSAITHIRWGSILKTGGKKNIPYNVNSSFFSYKDQFLSCPRFFNPIIYWKDLIEKRKRRRKKRKRRRREGIKYHDLHPKSVIDWQWNWSNHNWLTFVRKYF